MERRYVILDVFCNRLFAGNPLAVMLDGGGLNDDLMQKIAGEFNLSETVFVRSVDKANKRAKIRIFTPGQELPFAGHPTVGTATLIAKEYFNGDASDGIVDLVLDEQVGPVNCKVTLGADASNAQFTLPQLPEHMGECGSVEMIANALGLSAADIGFDAHKPQQWSAGVPYSLVPIANMDAIRNITPNAASWAKAFGEGHHNNAFVYCRECENRSNNFHARMFWPGAGIKEDAATGSAVAAFAGAIFQNENLIDGDHTFVIEQGYEMGRPSLINLVLEVREGKLDKAMIGGDVVEVARGIISV
jgi:trans-2,3-dihydro-3-hydroxyanthranilate isomerase